jgi:hypothetical protein
MEHPAHNDLSKAAWATHGGVHQELRGVVERIGSTLLDDTERYGAEFDVSAELALVKPVVLPVGSHLDLPPSLFGGLASPSEPTTPTEHEERLKLAGQYQEYVSGGGRNDQSKIAWSQWCYVTNSDRYPARLIHILDAHSDNGDEIDHDTWSEYVASGRQQLRDGNYNLETFVDFRYESLKAIYGLPYNQALFEAVATTQHTDMLYALSPDRLLSPDLTPADYLVAPIGDYGKPFAEKLLATMSHLQHRVDTSLALTVQIADEAEVHENALQIHTARSRLLGPGSTAIGLPNTEREGIMSTIQTAMLLTAERVEGYETGEALLADIIDTGLIEQFARVVPVGFIGPLTNTGRRVPGLVEVINGKLSLNPEKLAYFKQARQEQVAAMTAKWAAYRLAKIDGVEIDPPEVLGLVCPAAMPHGAITNTCKAVSRLLGLATQP